MVLAEKKKDIYSISFIHRIRRVVYDSAPFVLVGLSFYLYF